MPLQVAPAPVGKPMLAPSEDMLGSFLRYVSDLGLALYPAQEEAIFAILDGKHLVLATPTGSGKSLVAMAFLYKALCEGKRGFWSCPVKALVNEKFFDLCAAFGPHNVGLVTGDASVNQQAKILCGTAEVLAAMATRGDPAKAPIAECVVMDEFHYYGDRERGMAWQVPLIALPQTTFLLMSATLGDTTRIEERLRERTGREVATVSGMQRPVPLSFEYRETALHETIADLIKENRAPVYLVNFTQRAAAEQAGNLMSVDVCSKPEKAALQQALSAERFASPYGKELQRFLRHGIGIHHAGLLPRYRRIVERLAQAGLLKVVSGTDTLGVGVNIPIRSVLFSQLCKYDGSKDAILGVREFQQISGRAGRKGFDDEGWVVAQAPAHVIENKRLQQKAAGGKKVTMQKPPHKGYIHWDKGTFDRLVGGKPEPLESRFAVTHGLLLSLLQSERGDPRRGGGYRALLDLIATAHDSEHARRAHQRTAARCFRTLRGAGLVELRRSERARCPEPVPSSSLQDDFSLHHTLSLYLIETMEKLDPTSDLYALDVLSLVESILENPRPVLMAQLDRIKREAIAAMKAEGIPYEDRIAKLDELEWPKPNRDFIYATFNDFANRHPWVGQENIAPKGIARELCENFCSFDDFVRELGLQRVEGVLLRYLSQATRALSQSVPARFATAPVQEMAATLAAMLRTVDASLLEEWEEFGAPDVQTEKTAPTAAAVRDPAADPRAFAARVRAELHRLLGALARQDWDEAAACLRPADDAPGGLVLRLKNEMAPYFAQHARLVTTPQARSPGNTIIRPTAARVWDVQQRLIDPEGDEDWAIKGRIDLSALPPRGDDAPLVELLRIEV